MANNILQQLIVYTFYITVAAIECNCVTTVFVVICDNKNNNNNKKNARMPIKLERGLGLFTDKFIKTVSIVRFTVI